MTKRLAIQFRIEPDSVWQRAKGRDAWALLALRTGGTRGVTPIDTPGPRWSGYVFKLRRAGFVIETIDESHGGPFAGSHARYVLRSRVTILQQMGRAA
jgi:hypothetical protein